MLFYAYSCPLCNLNTLLNIILILHSYIGSYIGQVMTMCPYKNDNSCFHTFWVIPPWWFQMQFHVRSITWKFFLNIIMILHSYVKQVMMMCCIQEWQLSFLYFLSYFPLIVSDAVSCLLHNLKALWNILMILYSCVEQVMMICCIQEWQLSLPYFLSYFPLIISDAISCLLYNLNVLWNLIMILHSYVE